MEIKRLKKYVANLSSSQKTNAWIDYREWQEDPVLLFFADYFSSFSSCLVKESSMGEKLLLDNIHLKMKDPWIRFAKSPRRKEKTLWLKSTRAVFNLVHFEATASTSSPPPPSPTFPALYLWLPALPPERAHLNKQWLYAPDNPQELIVEVTGERCTVRKLHRESIFLFLSFVYSFYRSWIQPGPSCLSNPGFKLIFTWLKI